jgi:hypothetical protein
VHNAFFDRAFLRQQGRSRTDSFSPEAPAP